jgi:hypothetical protein
VPFDPATASPGSWRTRSPPFAIPQPHSWSVRQRSRAVRLRSGRDAVPGAWAVLPVPAASRRLTAKSRESSRKWITFLCSGRSRSDTMKSSWPRRSNRPSPRLSRSTTSCLRSRLARVATSRPARRTVPADSWRARWPFRAPRPTRPLP